jgi:uncharacterized membrane protein YsdA (DUF1294 family)
MNYEFFDLTFWQQLALLYLALINIMAFFYFGLDKLRSTTNSRRVSERMLWFLVAIGGSIGGLLAMKFFRHKTKKLSFQAGVAVILATQILLAYLLLRIDL